MTHAPHAIAARRTGPIRAFAVVVGLIGAASAGPSGCTCVSDRAACGRDGDCGNGEVCYFDDRCVPRAVAERLGANVGDECAVVGGDEIGCEEEALCRMGWCDGLDDDDGGVGDGDGSSATCTTGSALDAAPLFGGVTEASGDGPDAVVVRWIGAADETLPAAIRYLIYVATAPGQEDLATPVATVTGQTQVRVTGLTTDATYYFVVRAQDQAGQIECNANERSATPRAAGSCVDFATDVLPILTANCVSCHGGATPPRDLRLDSYAGVLTGGLTGNEVVGCQAASSLLYLKISQDNPPVGQRMPLGGPYLTATQTDTIQRWIAAGAAPSCPTDPALCSDANAPTFGGLTGASLTTPTAAHLCWTAGSDDVTAPGALRYDVYEADLPGGQSFSQPPRTTSPAGATCLDRIGLTPGQPYCWVVRARDDAGNRDANTVERCLTPPAAPCIDYASVIQPIFDGECVQCHAGPGAPRGLHLENYAGVIAGGATGNEVVACQPDASLLYQKITMSTPPVGARMPADGPPWLTTAQIGAIEQWIGEGGRPSCATPDPCSDLQPPSFAGLTTATAIDPTTVELCWSAASDNLTSPAQLLYDAYLTSTPGAEDFSAAPRRTSAAGGTCVRVDALSPATQHCWVVRARDGAGNRDSNTIERCVTTPAVPPGCVDYDAMIQPLLDHNCTRCHAGDRPPQWLRLDSYAAVVAGSVRRNEVVACDPGASLLVDKISTTPSLGRRMPYDGPPYLTIQQVAMVQQWISAGAQRSCGETSACGDTAAPSFAGVSSATPVDATTIRVCWPPATDAVTSAASLRYDVYEATSAGGQTFTQPAQHSRVGGLCTDVRVGPATTLCFVVRARDLAGNRSTTNVEACATTAPAACAVDYDALIQPILSARCTHCHQGAAAPRFLDLRTYGGALAGGSIRDAVDACDWAGSLLNTKTSGSSCGRRMPGDGPPWLAGSERSLLREWIGSGARRTCTGPSPCVDTVAPTFGGATTATPLSPTETEVCWAAASDAGSPTESIVYEIFDARTPGGQSYTRPAPYAASGAATCARIATPMATQTCFVVRARDLAGNRDLNTVQRCATPGGACFAFDDTIQPLFSARCVHCHSGNNAPNGIRWDTYAHAVGNTGEVRPCDAAGSKLLDETEACTMPQDTSSGSCRACLTTSQVELLRQWVDGGAGSSCPWGSCP